MAKILLVEDDLDVRFLLEHVLVDAGHEVVAAETVANGIKLLASRPFDLLVADGKLPDGTGLQVADQASERGVKTLMITGNAFALPAAKLQQYAYVLKPARAGEVLDMVRRLLHPGQYGGVLPLPRRS